MADEQEWSGYSDQQHLKSNDTILARASGGAGVEIPGAHVVSRRADGGTYEAGDDIRITKNTAPKLVLAHAINTTDGEGRIEYINRVNASSQGPEGQIGAYVGFQRPGGSIYYNIVLGLADTAGDDATARWEIRAAESCNLVPSVDNVTNIGRGSNRVGTIYAGTGTINTSDERDKTWRGELSEDEYAAALQIIDELGFFQWNDSIAEKGPDDARYHFGVRAQQAFDILDDHLGEGAWQDYAFACHDSWDDEFEPVLDENEDVDETQPPTLVNAAGDRYGLREGQFTMFLLAAQARRQKELELRVEALEA